MSEQTEFRTLTKKPASDASALVATAKSVLEAWSEIYLQVREKIEFSGRDPRCYYFHFPLLVYKFIEREEKSILIGWILEWLVI